LFVPQFGAAGREGAGEAEKEQERSDENHVHITLERVGFVIDERIGKRLKTV
jgi:hypothetical protein